MGNLCDLNHPLILTEFPESYELINELVAFLTEEEFIELIDVDIQFDNEAFEADLSDEDGGFIEDFFKENCARNMFLWFRYQHYHKSIISTENTTKPDTSMNNITTNVKQHRNTSISSLPDDEKVPDVSRSSNNSDSESPSSWPSAHSNGSIDRRDTHRNVLSQTLISHNYSRIDPASIAKQEEYIEKCKLANQRRWINFKKQNGTFFQRWNLYKHTAKWKLSRYNGYQFKSTNAISQLEESSGIPFVSYLSDTFCKLRHVYQLQSNDFYEIMSKSKYLMKYFKAILHDNKMISIEQKESEDNENAQGMKQMILPETLVYKWIDSCYKLCEHPLPIGKAIKHKFDATGGTFVFFAIYHYQITHIMRIHPDWEDNVHCPIQVHTQLVTQKGITNDDTDSGNHDDDDYDDDEFPEYTIFDDQIDDNVIEESLRNLTHDDIMKAMNKISSKVHCIQLEYCHIDQLYIEIRKCLEEAFEIVGLERGHAIMLLIDVRKDAHKIYIVKKKLNIVHRISDQTLTDDRMHSYRPLIRKYLQLDKIMDLGVSYYCYEYQCIHTYCHFFSNSALKLCNKDSTLKIWINYFENISEYALRLENSDTKDQIQKKAKLYGLQKPTEYRTMKSGNFPGFWINATNSFSIR